MPRESIRLDNVPHFGAWPEKDHIRFRVWAPRVSSLEVAVFGRNDAPVQFIPMEPVGDGFYELSTRALRAGDLYKYRVDGGECFPDPASRYQPHGVHGPSQVVDPRGFSWSDQDWQGIAWDERVVYELHVGTFSPAGTFDAVRERLQYLKDLGVTAVELMPVADFPGERNWGYDGVALFAPARCYGHPDDLRSLVDEAHRSGLAVFLDVVYNHLGPDGNYLGVYSRLFESPRHSSPWGAALNFDGDGSRHVRDFFIDNALHWIREYHFDGLRLDATHAIQDESETHFLAELTATVRHAFPGRRLHIIAEDHRNLATIVKPAEAGGWGLDGVWADDFHHQMRRCLAGDDDGYYVDYTGSTRDIAITLEKGWFYTGQYSRHFGENRGTDPAGIPPWAFVICLQNHDQIGNRAFGERLHHQVEPAAWRAASVLLLFAPQTPLLFMGQEWSASTPFLYFTDHHEELGRKVTEGRRNEFRQFRAFRDSRMRKKIPDPQALETFERSRLRWEEMDTEGHRETLALYRELLRLRRQLPAVVVGDPGAWEVSAINEHCIGALRWISAKKMLLVICCLTGAGVEVIAPAETAADGATWRVLLHTEEPRFCPDPSPPTIELGVRPAVRFARPGAVVLASD